MCVDHTDMCRVCRVFHPATAAAVRPAPVATASSTIATAIHSAYTVYTFYAHRDIHSKMMMMLQPTPIQIPPTTPPNIRRRLW